MLIIQKFLNTVIMIFKLKENYDLIIIPIN